MKTSYLKCSEFRLLRGCVENNMWHANQNVLKHTKKVMRKISEFSQADVVLLLAAQFHDVGKPLCLQENNGITSCKGHEKKSAEIANKRVKDLSPKDKRRLLYLIKNHTIINEILSPSNKNIDSDIVAFKRRPDYGDLLILGLADMLGSDLRRNAPREFRFRKGWYYFLISYI